MKRLDAAMKLSCKICLSLVLIAGVTITTLAQARNVHSGKWIAQHIEVELGPLPDWTTESTIMDDIWHPLGLHGVNFYAYGHSSTNAYASRSDPGSPLYQAWFGVYVVAGDETADIKIACKLANLDQRAWLASMGDKHPLGLTPCTPRKRGAIRIDGTQRPLYSYKGQSHSDLGTTNTPLAKHVGRPPASYWRNKVTSFHGIQLRGYFSLWYDAQQNLTLIVYTASPIFRQNDGKTYDDFSKLETRFKQMMQKVRVVPKGAIAEPSSHP